jgi:hypothetical protein
MKILVLKDSTWALLQATLKAEQDCAERDVAWAEAWQNKNNVRHFNMARMRKRRLETARLVREVCKQ